MGLAVPYLLCIALTPSKSSYMFRGRGTHTEATETGISMLWGVWFDIPNIIRQ